jgi:hypothetical protein
MLLWLLLFGALCTLWCVVGYGAVSDTLSARALLCDTFHDAQVERDCWLTSRGRTNKHGPVERWQWRSQGKVLGHARSPKVPPVRRAPAWSSELADADEPAAVDVGRVHVLGSGWWIGRVRVTGRKASGREATR